MGGDYRSMSKMDYVDKVCLALLDLAQGQKSFERLSMLQKEGNEVDGETQRLKASTDNLHREMTAFDQQREFLSNLVDSSIPPCLKDAAESVFFSRFEKYFADLKPIIDMHVMDARAIEVATVTGLSEAQRIELEEIASLLSSA